MHIVLKIGVNQGYFLFFNPFLAIPNILINFPLKKNAYDLKDLSKVQDLAPGGNS